MRRVSTRTETTLLRLGHGLLGLMLLASGALCAAAATAHTAWSGAVCGAGAAPHCAWCYGAAGLTLAGLTALAAATPVPALIMRKAR